MKTTKDVYILRGLYFIVKSAYQVRAVELDCKMADEITALWQQWPQVSSPPGAISREHIF